MKVWSEEIRLKSWQENSTQTFPGVKIPDIIAEKPHESFLKEIENYGYNDLFEKDIQMFYNKFPMMCL